MVSNKSGGAGSGSRAFSADYVRLVKGTADFPASRNRFLLSLFERQLKISTHPTEKKTILAAVKNREKAQDTIARRPDDTRLISVLNEAKDAQTAVPSPVGQQFYQRTMKLKDNPSDSPASPAPGSKDAPTIADLEPRMSNHGATPTTSSEFYTKINNILSSVSQTGDTRLWNVFCIKPNDDGAPKKFNDERVREQVKRLELGLLVSKDVGLFTVAMPYKDFYSRYGALEKREDYHQQSTGTNGRRRHQKHSSLASIGGDVGSLRNKCRSIYEMYGVITGGGNGKADLGPNKIIMNERSWWALERNLVAIELQKRMDKKKRLIDQDEPIAESGAEADGWDYESNVTMESDMSNVDMDKVFQRDLEEQLNEKRKRENEEHLNNMSSQRRLWTKLTKFLTWWIPLVLIKRVGKMERPEIIQAWREKVALNIIIMFLSGIMLFLITGFGELMCPKAHVFSDKDLAKHNSLVRNDAYIAVHGRVYDVSSYAPAHQRGENASEAIILYIGSDASKFFKRRTGAWPSECNFSTLKKRQAALPDEASSPSSPDSSSKPPSSPPSTSGNTGYTPSSSSNTGSGDCSDGTFTFCHDHTAFRVHVLYKEIPVYEVGDKALAETDIAVRNGQGVSTQLWVIVNNRVYDVTDGVRGKVFPDDVLIAMQSSAGRNAQGSYLDLLKSPSVMKCLESQFYVGVVDLRNSVQCVAASYSLLGLTILLCTIMLMKFLSAIQLGARRRPEETHRHVILQVPCYTENEESLKKTINSLALLDYDDDKKLLFIIADGLIKGSGNDRMTPEIVLDILGVENTYEKLTSDVEVPRFDYIALGDGMNRLNRAKVFSGHYTILNHRVPYIVVVKCGKETETRRPGNRGKRDSQMILMKFLNKVFHQRTMVPMELEMFRQIQQLGLDPQEFEYCLMVDADTEVLVDSLTRLISVMLHDTLIMGLCGETQIGNEMDTWVTVRVLHVHTYKLTLQMIQVYEYYISHHLAKSFESLFGSVTCLPGCFCMYRIRTNGQKPIPLLIDDEIIHDYEENNVDTLHKKNLLSLGEDRYLTTLMLKYFPGFRTKFTPDAGCRTIVPDKFRILFSQRRRW